MSTDTEIVLAARGVTMQFGGVTALSDVELELPKNTTTGLIGPNGSGKSTLLNVLTGIYRQKSGDVIFENSTINSLSPRARGNVGIKRSFQHPQLAESLTIRENIESGLRFATSTEISVDAAIRTFGCNEYADRLPAQTPYGFLKLAEIARAVVAGPKVLLLDEPAAGLNQDERVELITALTRFRSQHPTAICLIEHDVDLVRSLCPRLVVLESGKMLMAGPTDDVLSSAAVRSAYLGESAVTEELS